MTHVNDWGIWRSFNTPSDVLMAVMCLFLLIVLLYVSYNIIRPICCDCRRRFWFYQVTSRVVGGSGPETVETADFCEDCESYNYPF